MAEPRKNTPQKRLGKQRDLRNLLLEIACEFLIQLLPTLVLGAAGGTVYAAYLVGGIGLALMLIPLWIWLFYRFGKAAAPQKKPKNRMGRDGGGTQ